MLWCLHGLLPVYRYCQLGSHSKGLEKVQCWLRDSSILVHSAKTVHPRTAVHCSRNSLGMDVYANVSHVMSSTCAFSIMSGVDSAYGNADTLEGAEETEEIGEEAEEGLDTSLTLAEMPALALTDLPDQEIAMSGPLLACQPLKCLVNTNSRSIRKSMRIMKREVLLRSPTSMHHRRMMGLMACMGLRLVLVGLGREHTASMAPMVDDLLVDVYLREYALCTLWWCFYSERSCQPICMDGFCCCLSLLRLSIC